MDQQLMRRQSGEIQQQPVATVTQGFGTQEIAMRGERAAEAVAARENAMVQARFVMALKSPRDLMDFRARLLHECKRTGFSDVAMYKRPVGKVNGVESFAEGPSIRMIETCLQLFRNVQVMTNTVYDDAQLRIVKVMVIDFEGNTSFEVEIAVPKTVEKRGFKGEPPKGREVISKRINSYGDDTYLVTATDDEVTIKQAALVSKAIRTCGQRLLPRDIIEEAIEQIRKTKTAEVQQDPDAAKKKVADAFAVLGVSPSDIGAYLGHSIDRATPKEIVKLREIYTSIKDGESTWEEFMEAANTIPDPELQAETRARLIAEADAKKAAAEAAKQGNANTASQASTSVNEDPADDAAAWAPPAHQQTQVSDEPAPTTNRRGFKA